MKKELFESSPSESIAGNKPEHTVSDSVNVSTDKMALDDSALESVTGGMADSDPESGVENLVICIDSNRRIAAKKVASACTREQIEKAVSRASNTYTKSMIIHSFLD